MALLPLDKAQAPFRRRMTEYLLGAPDLAFVERMINLIG